MKKITDRKIRKKKDLDVTEASLKIILDEPVLED
jgi:hypothetical protein